MLLQHGVEGCICNSKHMRRQLAQWLFFVHLDKFGVVDGQELEWVDGNEDVAGVRVDLLLVETVAQRVQDARLGQEGKVAEVIVVLLLRRKEASAKKSPLGRLRDQVTVWDGAIAVTLLQRKEVALTLWMLILSLSRP